RMRGAHDPAEEAWPGDRHEPGLGDGDEFVEHAPGLRAGLGQRAGEAVAQRMVIDARMSRPGGDRLTITHGMIHRPRQQAAEVLAHLTLLSPRPECSASGRRAGPPNGRDEGRERRPDTAAPHRDQAIRRPWRAPARYRR